MKIKAICRHEIVYKNGKSPLAIRFTHQRTHKTVSLGISVEPHYWDKTAEMITANCPERAALQSQIDSTLAGYRKKIQRLEALDIPVTFDTLFETDKSRHAGITIEDGFNAEIERLESLGKINSATKHKYALQVLNGYKSVKTALEAIDLDYLKGLELHLRQRGNKDNSIATRFAIFKAIYNKALAEGIFTTPHSPFLQFKIGRLWTATRKRAIRKEEVQRLMQAEIPTDGSAYLDFARDIFLFSYLSAGINFKDIATLRYCDMDEERIYYARHKTSKEMTCHLSEQSKAIIGKYAKSDHADEDYIFPILDRRIHKTEQQIYDRVRKVLKHVNKALHEWSRLLGLKIELTTYVARHTFATVLKRSGVNIAIISESLGHSDLSTTQIYLDSFENSQIDAAMQNLL